MDGVLLQSWCRVGSPLGEILLAADEVGLTGLWFDGQKYFPGWPDGTAPNVSSPALVRAKEWLNVYFSGRVPTFMPPLHLTGTAFQNAVWEVLQTIPYGRTMSYAEVGRLAAQRLGKPKTGARAAGGAVGRNRISIIVPCHRVVGANGSLTGYAGGLARKTALLRLEGALDAPPGPCAGGC